MKLTHNMSMLHAPTIWGQGKWESKQNYIKYKIKRRRLNKIAAESRKRNR